MDMLMYALFALFLLCVIWCSNRHYKKIGNIGEKIVADKLALLPDDYIVINNFRLRNVQIDHLVICHNKKLIFVIETKMWCGYIEGSAADKKWKVIKDGQVSYYNNPIRQNNYHCKTVRQKYKGYSVRSIIVFVRCKSIPRYRGIISEKEIIEYIIRTSSKVSNRGIIDGESDWLSILDKYR